VAGHGHVVQVEFDQQLREIVSIGVHVIALPGLGGATVAAAIVGDDAVTA
jgi:hypothetical protein